MNSRHPRVIASSHLRRWCPTLLATGLFLVSVCPSLAAPTNTLDPEEVVARVGDREITLEELMFRFASLPNDLRLRYGNRLSDFLQDTAAMIALAQRGEEAGLAADPLFADLLALRREEILRDLYARQSVFSDIDEERLRKRYQEKLANDEGRDRIHLRQILVTSSPADGSDEPEEAKALARDRIEGARGRLEDGQAFGDVAREVSEGRTARDGGDLGWAFEDELLPQIAARAAKLAPGEISEVFETEQGFHVVQLVERRRGGALPFEAVREILFQELVAVGMSQFGARAAEQRQEILESADIELFPERLPWE